MAAVGGRQAAADESFIRAVLRGHRQVSTISTRYISTPYLQYLHHIYTISTRYLHCNNISYDASTMCEETVYWDLNYSLQVTHYTREQ